MSLLIFSITNAVFQLIVIPILVHHINAEKLGSYFLALSFGSLIAILVNYGTMQTSMVEIRKALTMNEKIKVIADTIAVRFVPLLLSIVIICVLPFFVKNGIYYFMILPMVLAEFINPQFYLIATYNFNKYTFLNLLFRVLLLLFIYIMRDSAYIILITLLGTGLIMLLLNIFFLKSVFLQQGVAENYPSSEKLTQLLKTNILVLGNGLTVHLQQSLFLFSIPSFVTPLYLSAYGFVDKLISSFRMLVNAYGSAVMPHAAGTHQQGFNDWKILKKQQNILLSVFCLFAGIIMFVFPEQLLTILLIGKHNNNQAFFLQVQQLIQLISLVPLLIALNVLNVIEIFLEKKYISYFGAGLFVLFMSLLCIDSFQLGLDPKFVGYYPMIIEGVALVTSFFIVQRIRFANN
jgi:O-antigen/teichoic acid export membrane protein